MKNVHRIPSEDFRKLSDLLEKLLEQKRFIYNGTNRWFPININFADKLDIKSDIVQNSTKVVMGGAAYRRFSWRSFVYCDYYVTGTDGFVGEVQFDVWDDMDVTFEYSFMDPPKMKFVYVGGEFIEMV